MLQLPVKRDGNFTALEVPLIVPGDVVFLRGGNVVPADCMWIEGDELAVDQAALTGESLPVEVPPPPHHPPTRLSEPRE